MGDFIHIDIKKNRAELHKRRTIIKKESLNNLKTIIFGTSVIYEISLEDDFFLFDFDDQYRISRHLSPPAFSYIWPEGEAPLPAHIEFKRLLMEGLPWEWRKKSGVSYPHVPPPRRIRTITATRR